MRQFCASRAPTPTRPSRTCSRKPSCRTPTASSRRCDASPRSDAPVRYNSSLLGTRHSVMANGEDARADIALLDRIVGRDERAVGELYDRHNRLLYGLILRILRDRAEAEEV